MNNLQTLWTWMNDRRGYIALWTLLLYNWIHSGSLLSRYVHPSFVGFIAAFGVELAVVELSKRIGERGWKDPQSAPFRKTLMAVLAVSAFANVAEGYAVKYGAELTLDAIPNIDPVQGIVGVAATGLLSWVVYRLSDITSATVQPVQILEGTPEQTDEQPSIPANTTERDPLLTFLASKPYASLAEIAETIGVKSKSTASNRVNALKAAGVLSQNGHGYEVHG